MQPTLAALARRLDADTFFQVSRNAIVSLDAIREAKPFPDGTGEVILTNGLTLPVTRRRWRMLLGAPRAISRAADDARVQSRPCPSLDAICWRWPPAPAHLGSSAQHHVVDVASSPRHSSPLLRPAKKSFWCDHSGRPTTRRRSRCSIRGSRRSNTSTCARTCRCRRASTAATWTLQVDGEVNTAADADARRPAQDAVGHGHGDPRVRRQRPRVLRSAGGRHPVGQGRGRHRALDRRAHGRRAQARRRQEHRPVRGHERRRSPARAPCPTSSASCRSRRRMHPDTMLAYEMNGQPIPPLHGFPLRAIVPGWEGAYSVKWLTSLRVVDRESDSFWVATAYRYPTKRVAPGAAVDPKDMAPLTGLVVKSLITRPLDGATVAPGQDRRGRLCVGRRNGHRARGRVDRSRRHAGSRRASPANRRSMRGAASSSHSTRTRPESYLIMSRATDASGRTQPMTPPWNPSGYLWNAPDRCASRSRRDEAAGAASPRSPSAVAGRRLTRAGLAAGPGPRDGDDALPELS